MITADTAMYSFPGGTSTQSKPAQSASNGSATNNATPPTASIESLLNFNLLASSLLDVDRELDLSLHFPGRQLTLPYFATSVVGPQRFRFSGQRGEEEDDNGDSDADDEADDEVEVGQQTPRKSETPLATPMEARHARNISTSTATSSDVETTDSHSLLSHAPSHSTGNTSFGSYHAFTKPGEQTSFLPPPRNNQHDESSAEEDATISLNKQIQDLPVAGIPSSPALPSGRTGLKISSLLKQQYDSGMRAPRLPLSPAPAAPLSPSLASDKNESAATSPPSAPKPFLHSNHSFPSHALKTASSGRREMLEDIIENDFADPSTPSHSSTRNFLWHPSEYVGPLRREKSSAGSVTFARLPGHRRTASTDNLGRGSQAASGLGKQGKAGHVSMNDLLLRPASDPRRQLEESKRERLRRGHPVLSRFNLRSHFKSGALGRSISSVKAFFGKKPEGSALEKWNAPVAPEAVRPAVPHIVIPPRTSRVPVPTFVVPSSPKANPSSISWPVDSGHAEAPTSPKHLSPPSPIPQTPQTPMSITSTAPPSTPFSSFSERSFASAVSGTSQVSDATVTSSRYQRSLRKIGALVRGNSGKKDIDRADSMKRKQQVENDRIADLSQKQVSRDASYRAGLVNRFNGKRS